MARCVAVVSDHPRFLAAARKGLAGAGYAVFELAAEARTLAALRAATPALVVLDTPAGQPARGWQFLAQVRSVPALAMVPVVVCAAATWDLQHHADDLRRHRAAVLPKPCATVDLLRHFARLLGPGG